MDDVHTDLSIGDRIRLWRSRAGLTQQEAAGLAGVSASLWRKWEQNVRSVDSFSRLVDIARALRVRDLRDLTGLPLPLSPGGVPRHDAVGPVRLALARHPALRLEPPPDLDQLTERVRAAWTGAQAASPWRYAATGALLPGLIADVEAAARADVDRRRAARLAGGAYLLVRAWAKWVGEHDLALLAAERSLAAAERTDDAALLAAAGWNMAQALSTRGDAPDVRQVVNDALGAVAADAGSENAPADLVSAVGALHLIGMVAAARLDERADARRALRAAAAAASRLGTDRNDWWLAFGPTNVAIHRTAYAVELGQARAAVRSGAAVAVGRSPSVERRVTHRLHLAGSHARLREDETAVRALLAAEAESPEQVAYSPRARSIVRELVARERPATRPLLRPLAGRLGVLD